MSTREGPPTAPGGADRLVYGYAGGMTRGPRRTALTVAAARGVDRGLGALGLARPVLLVSGFWRSGTTWLQECLAVALGAKTVFEPLSPMEDRRRALLAALYPCDGDGEDMAQATIPGPWQATDPSWAHLAEACSGRLATPFLMSCRRDLAESFRRGVVVKDVRLQANLAGFHARHRVPVVHVRRHPCAVVASLLAADWHWSFARVSLPVLLERLGAAVSDEDRRVAGRFDTDAAGRIAAVWALTERVAARALAGQGWGALIAYERFAAEPAAVLDGLCRSLGLVARHRVDFAQPSATVHPDAFAAGGGAGRERWRRLMAPGDIAVIEAAADALYPEWRTAIPGRNDGTRPA